MGAILLPGKPIAEAITEAAKAAAAGRPLRVAAVHNETSAPVVQYMKRQKAACEKAGIAYDIHEIGTKSQDEVHALLASLAADPAVTAITVHQPMPKGFDEEKLLQLVPADKDVEGTHPANLGRLAMGVDGPRPVAASGAIEILRAHRPDCRGLDALVVGRSAMVGRPAALLLLNFGAQAPTVTVAHSGTKDLGAHARRADIVVLAAGRANTLRGDMVKPGAIVLDIGINRTADGKTVGDANFEECEKVAGAITPVPGGVGPVAVALFLRNIVACGRLRA